MGGGGGAVCLWEGFGVGGFCVCVVGGAISAMWPATCVCVCDGEGLPCVCMCVCDGEGLICVCDGEGGSEG